MVSKYYPPDPSKIPDFATGLKEIYADQDKAWAAREAQDQENDKRRIEYSGDTIKMLESGFDFLGTVGKAFVTDKKKQKHCRFARFNSAKPKYRFAEADI